MTMFKPNIQVERLVVLRGGLIAYTANFHAGLNIICGENSSGKSTILDFLFFGLGGELFEWREAALLCDDVAVQVKFNGRTATLIREVDRHQSRPMNIYIGTIEEAFASRETWQKYPYSRSQKESFSQVLFRWLDLPQVAGEASSNLTIHQLLRILYSDQITPVDQLFKSERFDTELIRQTVGDLLCGGFDDELYFDQIRLREAKKELAKYEAELKSMFNVLGDVEHSLTVSWVDGEKRKIKEEIDTTQSQLEELEKRIFNAEVSNGLSFKEQEDSYDSLVGKQQLVGELTEQRDNISAEILDTELFITSLERKSAALRDSSLVEETVGNINFNNCPACLAPVDDLALVHACHLCKTPFDDEGAKARIMGLMNDVARQIKQAESVQLNRSKKLEKVERLLEQAVSDRDLVARRYKLSNRLPTTEIRNEARSLHRRLGYLERQLIELDSKYALIERIDAISSKKREINDEIGQLGDKIGLAKSRQARIISDAYDSIEQEVIFLLKQDLDRQSTFSEAKRVEFSFGGNRISVNGESYFSASSMVFLRNAFFVAFFAVALKKERLRHPRFLIMDTIEDKGMEPERSHNFQRLLAEISLQANVDHQLIYATSMIAPELKDTDFMVDRFYTHDNRTLRLG